MEHTRGSLQAMETQQEPEAGGSTGEEVQKSQRSSMENEITESWKKAAFILGAAAILFLAGLATSLGIFLTKTECAAPPGTANSTTTYLGSASPGATVTYLCQSSLLFPDNSPSFTLTCTDNLEWEPKEIPSCGIYTRRVCSLPDLNLILAGRPSNGSLEIEITLRGPPPASMQVDIPTYDDAVCGYDGMVQESPTMQTVQPTLPDRVLAIGDDQMVVVVMESVDPWAPYAVRLRGIGTKVAVTVLQGDNTATVFTSLAGSTTSTGTSTHTGTTHTADTTASLDTTTVV